METTPAETAHVYRTAVAALLGLTGAGTTIVLTTPPAPTTTVEAAGALLGLFFAFVGAAGVVESVRSR